MIDRLPRIPPIIAMSAMLIIAGSILLSFGRPVICTCGTVALWGHVGPEQSQMLADWYSPSHLVHGFLFYAALRWMAPRWPIEARFIVALTLEAAWELVENTPLIIDRYRQATIALGYSGDSIINSMSDIVMMAIGFLGARRLPIWANVALIMALELIPLIAIRDNLTLNVWMLLAPNDAIRAWQAG